MLHNSRTDGPLENCKSLQNRLDKGFLLLTVCFRFFQVEHLNWTRSILSNFYSNFGPENLNGISLITNKQIIGCHIVFSRNAQAPILLVLCTAQFCCGISECQMAHALVKCAKLFERKEQAGAKLTTRDAIGP